MIYIDELVDHSGSDAVVVRKYGAHWCHMFSGDLAELHEFAINIGMKRSWFQGLPDHQRPHYDLRPSFRAKAVKAGAFELNYEKDDHMKLFASNAYLWRMRRKSKKLKSLNLEMIIYAIYLTHKTPATTLESLPRIETGVYSRWKDYVEGPFADHLKSLPDDIKSEIIKMEELLNFSSEYHRTDVPGSSRGGDQL